MAGRGGGGRPSGGVRLHQARCQASSCSRRRVGGGPGAPRSPAAADANLCPPAQQAAGGLGAPAGVGWGGLVWAPQGRPSSPGIAASAGTSGSGAAAAIPAGTGCHSMSPTPPPPMSPPYLCCPQFPPAPLSAPQIPIILNKHPSPTPAALVTSISGCLGDTLGVPNLSITPLALFPNTPTPDSQSPLNAPPPQSAPSVPMPPSPKSPHLTPDPSMPLHLPIPPEIPHHPTVPPPPWSPHPTPAPPVTLNAPYPLQAIPGIPWGCPVCYCRVSPLCEEPGVMRLSTHGTPGGGGGRAGR